MHAYEYAKALNYKATQEYQITTLLYSARNMEIYMGSYKSITIWSLNKGIQTRYLSNAMRGEITQMCFDDMHRKLFVCDQKGSVR